MRSPCWCGYGDNFSVGYSNVFIVSRPEGEMWRVLLEPARIWIIAVDNCYHRHSVINSNPLTRGIYYVAGAFFGGNISGL